MRPAVRTSRPPHRRVGVEPERVRPSVFVVLLGDRSGNRALSCRRRPAHRRMTATTILLIPYGVIALLMLRPAAGHFAWKESNKHHQLRPDSEDWWFGGWKGLLVAGLWPVLLVAFVCVSLANRTLPKVGAEREAERKMRERRLKELERELELDQ